MSKLKIKEFKCRNCGCRPAAFYEDIQQIQKDCQVGKRKCDIKKISLDPLPHRKTIVQTTSEAWAQERFPIIPEEGVTGDEFEDEQPLHEPQWLESGNTWVPCDCVNCVYEVQKRINRGYMWSIKDGVMVFEKDDLTPVNWNNSEHGNLCECEICMLDKKRVRREEQKPKSEFVEKEYPDVVEYVLDKKGTKNMVYRHEPN